MGEAFGFVFRSRNWFGRLAVGALCLLFFWLFLIPYAFAVTANLYGQFSQRTQRAVTAD